jgi:hypothetical protein
MLLRRRLHLHLRVAESEQVGRRGSCHIHSKLIGRSSVQYVAVLLLSLFWRTTSNDDDDDGRSM